MGKRNGRKTFVEEVHGHGLNGDGEGAAREVELLPEWTFERTST